VKTLWITTLFGLAAIVSVGGPNAYAQFEVDPDHFETREPEPLLQSKANSPAQPAKTHYVGDVTLPYPVQCDRRTLSAGKYSVSLDSNGGTAQMTLNRKGATVTLQGVAQRQNGHRGEETLVVERNGGRYHLSAVHLAQRDLMFKACLEYPYEGKPGNIEKIALILAKPRE
jgi:hypothetical protein